MNIYGTLAASHPSLARGQVWCRSCGHTQKVNTPGALAYGWPRCCGATMTIDSPEEQKRLAEARSALCASPRSRRVSPDEPMFPLSPPAKGGGGEGDSGSSLANRARRGPVAPPETNAVQVGKGEDQ